METPDQQQHRLDDPVPIHWNFDPGVPTLDFFAKLDLNDPADVDGAVQSFLDEMADDRFRTWEAVIRYEQGLPCTEFLYNLADRWLPGRDDDDRVWYVEDAPRHSEPWYEIVRKLAPRLLLEPFRTFETLYDAFTEGWPSMAAAIENRRRGLSLPEGVREPLDVLPADLRHKLWLQCCFDALSGLGQEEELTLANEDQLDRIDLFIEALRRHGDSVRFLELTLNELLQRVALPEADQPIFVRMMCERLGLEGPDAPLSPHLLPKPVFASEPVGRLPEDVIKQAMLHEEPVLREMAADYWDDSCSADPVIARLALQAVKKYGPDSAFGDYRLLRRLAHNEESVAWMVRQLWTHRGRGEWSENYCFDLSQALSFADPSLLEPHRREIKRMRRMDPKVRNIILSGADRQQLAPDELWKQFQQLVAEPVHEYPVFPETEMLRHIVALLHDDERVVRWVLDTLARNVDDPQYNMWLEGVAVQMAGELRLPAAAPYLALLLHDDDNGLTDDAIWSLSRIGTDDAVAALACRYETANEDFRRRAPLVLQDIHTDACAATLLAWLENEADAPTRQRILRALLCGFVPSAIEPARQELLAAKSLTPRLRSLRIELVAVGTLAGAKFPELAAWKQEAQEDYSSDEWEEDDEEDEDEEDEEDQWGDRDDEWGAPEDEEEDWGEPEDEEEDWGEPEDEDDQGEQRPDDDEPAEETGAVICDEPKIGRNDPCPCGSGKKYKKCCMRRGS